MRVWAYFPSAFALMGGALASCGQDPSPSPSAGGTSAAGVGGVAGSALDAGSDAATGGAGGLAGSGGASGAPCSCAALTPGPCSECLRASCCDQCSNLDTNPDAINLLDCAAACSDPSCTDGCVNRYPQGEHDWRGLVGCAQSSCASPCGSCGEMYAGDPPCERCMQRSCCSQGLDCSIEPACQAYGDCVASCAEPDDSVCQQACAFTYPDGRAPWDALQQCLLDHCDTDCPLLCGIMTGINECDDCLSRECCSEGNGCASGVHCIEYVNCVFSCNFDIDCQQRCATTYPYGPSSWGALDSCLETKCTSVCTYSLNTVCGRDTGIWACDQCLEQACCFEGQAYAATPNDGMHQACLTACGFSAPCQQSCQQQFPAEHDAYGTFVACLGANCASDCGHCGFHIDEPACNGCMESSCCAQGRQCAGNSDCAALYTCLQACTPYDLACQGACVGASPLGVDDLQALQICLQQSCSAHCGPPDLVIISHDDGIPESAYAPLSTSPGDQIGVSLRPTYYPTRLLEARFFIVTGAVPHTPFRVRVYAADGPSGAPRTELLTSVLTASATTGGEWVTVDLSFYDIIIDQGEFFVTMEWLTPPGPSGQAAQRIGIDESDPDRQTWSLDSSGTAWTRIEIPEGTDRDAMIRAAVYP